jgi:cob(I)alamin adenosyltransferase
VHLFDLGADIGEEQNRAEQDAERVASLRAAIAGWEEQLVEPAWGK